MIKRIQAKNNDLCVVYYIKDKNSNILFLEKIKGGNVAGDTLSLSWKKNYKLFQRIQNSNLERALKKMSAVGPRCVMEFLRDIGVTWLTYLFYKIEGQTKCPMTREVLQYPFYETKVISKIAPTTKA